MCSNKCLTEIQDACRSPKIKLFCLPDHFKVNLNFHYLHFTSIERAKNAQNQNGALIWLVFSAQMLHTGPQWGVISPAPTAFQGPLSEKSDTAKSVTKTIWGFPGGRSAALRWDFCIRNDGSAQAASQVWGPLLRTRRKGWNRCGWNLREVRAPSILTHTVIVDLYEKTWTRFLFCCVFSPDQSCRMCWFSVVKKLFWPTKEKNVKICDVTYRP